MTGSGRPPLTLLTTPDAAVCIGDVCDIPAVTDSSAGDSAGSGTPADVGAPADSSPLDGASATTR